VGPTSAPVTVSDRADLGIELDLFRVETQERANVRESVTVMAPDGAVQRERSRPAPAAHGLGTDPEEFGDLGRGQQMLRFGIAEKPFRKVLLLRAVQVHIGILEPNAPVVPN
jgi:hypothetical protein